MHTPKINHNFSRPNHHKASLNIDSHIFNHSLTMVYVKQIFHYQVMFGRVHVYPKYCKWALYNFVSCSSSKLPIFILIWFHWIFLVLSSPMFYVDDVDPPYVCLWHFHNHVLIWGSVSYSRSTILPILSLMKLGPPICAYDGYYLEYPWCHLNKNF